MRRGISIVLLFLAVGLWLGCQGFSKGQTTSSSPAYPAAPSGEILYLINNGDLSTYNVDPGTLQPSPVSSSVALFDPSASLIQFVPSPDDHFLYVLWSDSVQQEHLSTFATDAWGIPQVPPLQTVDVFSLSQLNIHPNGRFAYAMQSSTSNGLYVSKILLFPITASGAVQNPQVKGVYGPSLMPALLDGLSPDGSQLYLDSDNGDGPEYWERTVNGQNGTLAADVLLLQPPAQDSIVLGATLMIDYENAMNCSGSRDVNVLPNEPTPARALIQCGSTMLAACGDASNVQFDPSGKYLFLTDPEAQQVRVGMIDLSRNLIRDTGEFLPFTAETPGFAFSPDGTLVYAVLASDGNLHLYRFDPKTANLTQGPESIPISSSAGFMPALRQ
jgi:DNA-binding beta-propeller fold protein YncE